MENIRDIRKTLDISQAELAKLLGVEQSTVSRWERGDLPLNPRTRMAIDFVFDEARRQKSTAA